MGKSRFLVVAAAICMGLGAVGCGSGFVQGWRDDAAQTDQDRCERREGWLWQGETCARYREADLSLVDERQVCEQIADAEWIGDQCLRHSELSLTQCETFSDLTWEDERCMSLTEYTCRIEDKVYEYDKCVNPK